MVNGQKPQASRFANALTTYIEWFYSRPVWMLRSIHVLLAVLLTVEIYNKHGLWMGLLAFATYGVGLGMPMWKFSLTQRLVAKYPASMPHSCCLSRFSASRI